jgi:hypothetical protein
VRVRLRVQDQGAGTCRVMGEGAGEGVGSGCGYLPREDARDLVAEDTVESDRDRIWERRTAHAGQAAQTAGQCARWTAEPAGGLCEGKRRANGVCCVCRSGLERRARRQANGKVMTTKT